jgi:hypothetical protein
MTELQGWTDSLVECLLLPDPGMACPAVTALMAPGYALVDGVRTYQARHYLGVVQVGGGAGGGGGGGGGVASGVGGGHQVGSGRRKGGKGIFCSRSVTAPAAGWGARE